MTPRAISADEKKRYISDVGQELERAHGKRKFYKPEQVRDASRRRGYARDLDCWAHCFFETEIDFNAFHQAMGEVCDYAAMKAEVVSSVAGEAAASVLSIDLSWLEWPDIDLSSIFDWFD